ncbi:MAG: DUF6807 family protein [Balneolales bacterium]
MKNNTGISDLIKGTGLVLAFMLAACSGGQSGGAGTFRISAGDQALVHAPAYADLPSGTYEDNDVVCLATGSGTVAGQIETISSSTQRLWWIANQPAGETATYAISPETRCSETSFSWQTVNDQSTRLVLGDQPVLQYEHPVYDADNVEDTKKPYHHVFRPGGHQMISKGLGGLYPHHRGIFFGYSEIYREGSDQRINIWSSGNGERSEHVEIIREFSGPVMGGHIVRISWKDHDGIPFAEETRVLRVFQQPAGESLIDFHTTLTATDGPVRLEGDRQHAGVQFRAAQVVADHAGQNQFIRPDHLAHVQPAEEIGEDDMMNLPWNAMHFSNDELPFTIVYMSHPSNPDAEMSERLYGRFGEYFPHYLTADDPLEARYRFWITSGAVPSASGINIRHHAYTGSPSAELTGAD